MIRKIKQIVTGRATKDGAGVRLERILPAPGLHMLDPFLLLDVFSSENPDDYIAGFPPHPHRGFETVTYLLAGQMRHHDSAGHMGVIKAGGVQWMTAAKGILHSEMPEQENGLLQGFQLWVNLPAKLKIHPPAYQEFAPDQIKQETLSNGTVVKVIAGTTSSGVTGPVTNLATKALFFDIAIPAKTTYMEYIPREHNAFIYLISGSLHLEESQPLSSGQLAVLDRGDRIEVKAKENCRLLLIAGRPINEPVARHGPFVMNTDAEIDQAYRDFENGKFGRIDQNQGKVA